MSSGLDPYPLMTSFSKQPLWVLMKANLVVTWQLMAPKTQLPIEPAARAANDMVRWLPMVGGSAA
jgi:hypothetical protein